MYNKYAMSKSTIEKWYLGIEVGVIEGFALGSGLGT